MAHHRWEMVSLPRLATSEFLMPSQVAWGFWHRGKPSVSCETSGLLMLAVETSPQNYHSSLAVPLLSRVAILNTWDCSFLFQAFCPATRFQALTSEQQNIFPQFRQALESSAQWSVSSSMPHAMLALSARRTLHGKPKEPQHNIYDILTKQSKHDKTPIFTKKWWCGHCCDNPWFQFPFLQISLVQVIAPARRGEAMTPPFDEANGPAFTSPTKAMRQWT